MRLFLVLIFMFLPVVVRAQEKPVPQQDEVVLNQSTIAYSKVSDVDLAEVAGSRGSKYLEHIQEAAALFGIPADFLLVQIKQESFFSNLALTDDNGNGSIGVGQVNLDEWKATGQEPEIQKLGISDIFTAENFKTSKGGLHPRYNILALTAALRRVHNVLLQKPQAQKDGFGNSLASWLFVGGAYNGGPSIWSTVYDEEGDNKRSIDWARLTATELVKLIRTGHGTHADFWKQSVANHVGMLSVFLFQSEVKFCKLNYKDKAVVKCGLTAEQKLSSLANYWANVASCGISETPVDEHGNPKEGGPIL